MPLNLPNDLANHTPADASPVQENFSYIEQYVNTDVITRDGRVEMQAPLQLAAGSTTQPLHAATKMYVDAILPVGIILPYGGEVAPAGSWALCNGAPLLVSSYLALHGVLGYRYGGNNTDTFWLPNLRGRVPIGRDERTSGADARFDHTGDAGGSFVVPVPEHSHPMPHTHLMPHTHGIDHTHPIPHTHTINHNHGAASVATEPAHDHHFTMRSNSAPGASGAPMASNNTGAAVSSPDTTLAGGHTHAVTVANYSGGSGAASPGSSSGASKTVTDASSPGSTGDSSATNTSNTGTAAVEMVPPYVTLSYIIRIA